MTENKLNSISKLIDNKKIDKAQMELSKLGSEFLKNTEYLYLRSKIFFINKLYYVSLDTLLVSTEFGNNEKVYNLISEIYKTLGNTELSNKIKDPALRLNAIASLKKELTGISQQGYKI